MALHISMFCFAAVMARMAVHPPEEDYHHRAFVRELWTHRPPRRPLDRSLRLVDGPGRHTSLPLRVAQGRLPKACMNSMNVYQMWRTPTPASPPRPQMTLEHLATILPKSDLIGGSTTTPTPQTTRPAAKDNVICERASWFTSATARLEGLRGNHGRGQELVWLAVLRSIEHRSDPSYMTWCKVYLRPLRHLFGRSLLWHQYTEPLSDDEIAWAMDVEFAAAQD